MISDVLSILKKRLNLTMNFEDENGKLIVRHPGNRFFSPLFSRIHFRDRHKLAQNQMYNLTVHDKTFLSFERFYANQFQGRKKIESILLCLFLTISSKYLITTCAFVNEEEIQLAITSKERSSYGD